MFVYRHTGTASGVLHARLFGSFVERRPGAFAAMFSSRSAMRILAAGDGRQLEAAQGRAGVASLVRAIHENVELRAFTATLLGGAVHGGAFAWSANVRNWGFGAPRPAQGCIALVVDAGRILRADVFVDAALYIDLVRPDAVPAASAGRRQATLVAV